MVQCFETPGKSGFDHGILPPPLFMLHLRFIYEKFPVKMFEIKFIALKVAESFLDALDECIAWSRKRLYYYAILGISATVMGGSLFNPPTGQHGFFRPTREASKTDHTEFSLRPGTHQK
ncbi:hypothetical protein TNCV_1236491 [Trichonephila clavipes]|nr:hypothetical protein TNCV_1236491 [Trichonephila clavipes]